MTDETVNTELVEQEVAQPETSGQELESTAAADTGEGERQEPELEEQEVKTFTQEELEAEIGKRLARERRKFERQQQQVPEPPPLQLESQLNPNDFETTEAYVEALAEERAEALIQHREQSRSIQAVELKYQDQIDSALEKYPDYIQVAHTHPHMTTEMANVIKASDIAVELGYYLGTNLKEAERISKLPAMQQIKELGKLEARLESAPPEPTKVSSAPAPIKPIQGAKTTVPAYDTTDPRSTQTMTASQWIAADRARREKALKAKGYN